MTQVANQRVADHGTEHPVGELERGISGLLGLAPYAIDPGERQQALLLLLKSELDYACQNSAAFHNYVRHWPVRLADAHAIADLPYLPVSAFKANPPLSLIPAAQIKRTLTSSSTSGQVPSRVVLDAATSRRMTKGVLTIIRDFIGSARRPYLVIDTKENLGRQSELGARGAAIQALGSFATEIVPCLDSAPGGNSTLDLEKLLAFANQWKDASVLVYGFTYVIWTQLVQPLKRRGIKLNIADVQILHSGGWKRLEQQSVTKDVFNREVADVFGCAPNRIIDYYGMVENVGVVYPDCEHGCKHVPAFADVIIRDPLTLAPAKPSRPGIVQVCSALPTSFPGFLLLTDDMGEVVGYDGCACGRRGTYFRFLRRVPKVETRGCGNLETMRHQGANGRL